MKKLTSAFAALILLLSILAGALAQEEVITEPTVTEPVTEEVTTQETTEATPATEEQPVEAPVGGAGVTPDSPLWGLDRAIERLDLLLTLNKAQKAKKGLMHARERLVEVRQMIQEKKLDAASKAGKAHKEKLKEVEEDVAEIEDGDENEKLEDEVELESEVEEQEDEVEELESRIRVKVKGTLTAEQQAALDALIASFKDSTASVKIKVRAEKDNTKLRIKVKEGKTDEEIEELEERIREKHGIGRIVRELARAQRETEE
mgnify:FL=1